MQVFLRKKSTVSAKSRPLPEKAVTTPAKPQNTSSPQDAPSTPLYEKFTSAAPAVSGPMALGSRAPVPAKQNTQQQQRPGQAPRLVTVPSTRTQRPPSSYHEKSNESETKSNTDKPLPQPIPQTQEIKPVQRGDSLHQPVRRVSLQQSQQPRLGNAIVPRRVDHSEPLHRPPHPDISPIKSKPTYGPPKRSLSTVDRSYEAKPIPLTPERYSGESARPRLEVNHHHLSHRRDSIQTPSTEPSRASYRSSGYQAENNIPSPPDFQINGYNGYNGYNVTPHIPIPPPQQQPFQRDPPMSQPPQPSLLSSSPSRAGSKPGKPLIFAAMGAAPEDEPTPRPQPDAADYWDRNAGPYPSPPQEFSSSRNSPTRRDLPRPPPAQQPPSKNFASPPPVQTQRSQAYSGPPRRPVTPEFTPMPKQPVTPGSSPPRNHNGAPRIRTESKASEASLSLESASSGHRDSFISANSQLEQDYRALTPPKQKVLTKARPMTPSSRTKERPTTPASARKDRPSTPASARRDRTVTPPPRTALTPVQPVIVNGITVEGADTGELLDSDPFAKTEGVVIYGANGEVHAPARSANSSGSSESFIHGKNGLLSPTPEPPAKDRDDRRPSTPTPSRPPSNNSHASPTKRRPREEKRDSSRHRSSVASGKYRDSRMAFFPLVQFVGTPVLLAGLLRYLSFADWCNLSTVSKKLRDQLHHTPRLREEILERYLWTVGYTRWEWGGREALPISVQQLHEYMRGVSMPTYQYAQVSQSYLNAMAAGSLESEVGLRELAGALAAGTRAYTRLVCRVRAQVEAEQAMENRERLMRSRSGNMYSSPPDSNRSRAPSPSRSVFSSGQSIQAHPQPNGQVTPPRPVSPGFRSPLYKPRRAPLLRLFVPSPDGDWLSDASVLQCEAELKSSIDNALGMLRVGDVVWDLAVGDESNVGRMIWDGCYLIDLDYTFSPAGDLPKYIHTLAFPPSYFHRVIRSGPGSGNPIAHIDITPWGEEIAGNLQLLQDRIRTETPQGNHHNVVRWIHRSSFQIQPQQPVMNRSNSTPYRQSQGPPRIPIPGVPGAFVDSGWYGTVVVETEGTNEHLADLQDRCGRRAFPQRKWNSEERNGNRRKELRNTYRVLREKSRPGEIWIRTVSEKEMKL